MPREWYLAQGLVPVTPSSSDDEEGPCQLPNGRIVCGPHGLSVCGKGCTAYPESDTDSQEEDLDDDDSPGLSNQEGTPIVEARPMISSLYTAKIRGTGQVFPSIRQPPPAHDDRPTRDRSKVLIMADGACLNNGQANPKAGWAFFQGEKTNGEPLVASGRLEKKGPWGDDGAQTSNRAELRAVIAALRFLTSSFLPLKCLEESTAMTTVLKPSPLQCRNKDLWEILLGECERARDNNLEIQFWKIPREWNTLADEGAKRGAEDEAPEEWSDVMGLAC